MSTAAETLLGQILVCPVCHCQLDGPRCTGCGRVYENGAFIPDPLPDRELRKRARLWQELEANGARAYELDPPSSLSIGDREDAQLFAEFSQLEGLILDVGCGPQALPSYAEAAVERFVGVDPLRGEQPHHFAFAQAIAEYLPFKDDAFDRVLFATSIDHVLSIELALAEARRVTKAGGMVCIWLGEAAPPPPPEGLRERLRRRRVMEVTTPRVTMSFRVPKGAADAFHAAHPSVEQVEEWLEQVGLQVVESKQPLPNHRFLRALAP